jgi:hypothetical protein
MSVGIKEKFSEFFKMNIEVSCLNAAINLNLLEILENNFFTVEEVKEKANLKCLERNLQDVLDKLYVCRYLFREGEEGSFRYKTADKRFLKSSKENNILPELNLYTNCAKRACSMPELLKTGKKENVVDIWKDLYKDEEVKEKFLKAMGNNQRPVFQQLASLPIFSNFKLFTDVGGALADLSIEVKKKNPHLICINYDLPAIEHLVLKHLEETNMKGEVIVQNGDFFNDVLPKSDIIHLGNILHDYNNEKKKLILRKCYDSLNEGGILLMSEFLIDNERTKEIPINVSIVMMTECIDGFNMSLNEVEAYAKETGFKNVEVILSLESGNMTKLEK